MNSKLFCELAGRLMRCPAAPYHESPVRAEAELICAQFGLRFERDSFGNLLVRFQSDPAARPLILAAHLDHPGFEILRPLSPHCWLGRFLGGVPEEYFRQGIPLRLFPGGTPAELGAPVGPEWPGSVAAGKRLGKRAELSAPKQFEIHALHRNLFPKSRRLPLGNESDLASTVHTSKGPPQFAVWDLEDFSVERGRIHGRACDDLIGVTAILCALIELKKTRARVNVLGVISRAEEIGFQGALTVAAANVLPADSLVVSLETSREIPPVKMGEGVIIRVGDRTAIFDSSATRFLTEVAQDLSAKDASFQFQRALMSGGTCEGAAYQEFGFETCAVCVALGNYHNCAPRKKIAPEFISIPDACSMVRLLVETARRMPLYPEMVGRWPKQLNEMLKIARQSLRTE